MQMLAVVIPGNEGTGQTGESNRIRHGLSQIRDPPAGAKCSHLWQPWNIRRTIAGFHCKPHFTNPIPGYCFSLRCRIVALFLHPQTSLPVTDPEGTAMLIQVRGVRKSPIGHHLLCGNQALYRLSLQRYRVIPPALHFLATCGSATPHPPSW